MDKDKLIKLGSKTAKNGFKNEYFVIEIFNQWKTNQLAQQWLTRMDYILKDIEYVKAVKIKGSYKADIQITVKLKN